MEVWEYGIAVGIMAVIVPAFMGIVVWIVKRAMSDARDAAAATLEATNLTFRQTAETTRVQFEELKGIQIRMNEAILAMLRERDSACSVDHSKLVGEIHRLNTHLSELTGMLNFVLDHYIKSNNGGGNV